MCLVQCQVSQLFAAALPRHVPSFRLRTEDHIGHTRSTFQLSRFRVLGLKLRPGAKLATMSIALPKTKLGDRVFVKRGPAGDAVGTKRARNTRSSEFYRIAPK